MSQTIHGVRPVVVALLLFGASLVASSAQAQSETFSATATVKNPAGAEVSAPVTIGITRVTSDAERSTVVAALKKGGTAAVVAALKAMPDAGYIEVGGRKTPVKYAYVRPIGGGRLVTVVAPTTIVHLGSGLPDAKPKTGFDLSLAILTLNEKGAGSGELIPAGTIKADETGAVQTQDYGAEVVRLTNVAPKK